MSTALCPVCRGDGATYVQVRVGQHATPFVCTWCDGDGEVPLAEVGLTEKTRATQRDEETAMSEDEMDRACEWSDYRKAYGVSAGAMTEAHKAFKAGWDAARGHSHEEGPTR